MVWRSSRAQAAFCGLAICGNAAWVTGVAGYQLVRVIIGIETVVEEVLVDPATDNRPDLATKTAEATARANLGLEFGEADVPHALLAAVLAHHLVDSPLQRGLEPEAVVVQGQDPPFFQGLADPGGEDSRAAQERATMASLKAGRRIIEARSTMPKSSA